jgi:O-antigen/teichoic acid export membrane protein
VLLLYRATPFLTISDAAKRDLVALGVPADRVHVAYLGVEPSQFQPGARSPEPTLLYLGRLKQYKRIEVVLDCLEAVPEAVLEIAGDGDHRPALEAEIERRGLADRVVMHGHVDEDEKAALYARAWVSLTASSAEGWCLTVMEAAACGTPSAALRVGGLPESIVEGETGVLADSPEELAARVRDLVRSPAERDRLGAAAEARARTFTWDRTAEQNLAVLREQAGAERHSLRRALAGSDTAKAAGLAAATMASNVISLGFTVVFARFLGTDGYGSLAALVSTFLILSVPGLALQVAAARETALGRLGEGGMLSATHTRWMRELALGLVVLGVAGIVLRDQLAALIGVPDDPWAAASVLATGVAWLGLSVERGLLQGLRAYKAAGLSVIIEATGRLVLGLVLVAGGLGVTGAYLASPLSMITVAAVLAVVLRRRLGPPAAGAPTRRFERLVAGAWAPVLGLTLLAVLQNIDVIIVKHRVGGDGAGAYAAAAVAAKVVIWVGIGLAYYLVPEAARRAQAGGNPRGALARALAIISLVAAPMLLIYAAFPGLVLKLGFDVDYAGADSALVVLGTAMTLLAVASLAVQYMLAIEQYSFMWLLAVVAAVEPLLLSNAGTSLVGLATVVLALQCIAASGMLALSLRAPRRAAAAVP